MMWLLALLAASAGASTGYQTRCGWLDNPTPGNWSLFDHDGEWEIGAQGGREPKGPDFPDFGKQWVETNGSYGYGCACLDARVHRKRKLILAYQNVKVLPLKKCRHDPHVPRR